jgi:hypothetical protein
VTGAIDNDFSVTENPRGIQFDEYFNPDAIARIFCRIGPFTGCFSVNADGTAGGAYSGPFGGFALLPGVLYAYRSTGAGLAACVAPVPPHGDRHHA